MAAVTICSDFGAEEKKSVIVSTVFPSICHEVMRTDGETVETVTDFILGGSRITADGDCSHEI